MKLTIVGCSGSYPGPDSAASCYLLEAEGVDATGASRAWRIVLDLGNGALGQLHRYVDPLSIDAVVISHLHPDHCLDLCGYYVMRKYHPSGAQPVLPVHGPSGTAERMARAYDLPLDPGMREEFDFRTLAGSFDVGPFRIEPSLVEHPVEAYALKVSAGGRTLVYSGDTGPCAAFDELATGADLLLAEASFQASATNPPGLHMTGTDCGRTAARAQVGRLLLTHIPPWYSADVALMEARAQWDGPIELAAAGAIHDV